MVERDSTRRAVLEIAAVIATGVAFLVLVAGLKLRLPFMAVCLVSWVGYLAWRVRRDSGALRAWGLRTDELRAASSECLVVFVFAAAGLVTYRMIAGWRPMPASAIPLFVLYPAWGLVQQLLVQGLVTRNLRELGMPRAAIVPAVALLFGMVHLPGLLLTALTVAAGAVWTVLYLRHPNVIPLGFAHGWLGTLAYVWVLERDPWAELFGGG